MWSFRFHASVILVASLVFSMEAGNSNSNSTSCPTWFHYNTTTERCECGIQDSWVQCDQDTKVIHIQSGFCVTRSRQEGLYYAVYCPLRYRYNETNRMFSELPMDPSLLEDMMCGPYNRKGFLCSECISGYGPGVYTFDRSCAKCSNYSLVLGIVVYILADIVPIILFFLCAVVFRLDITAGPLLAYVTFCQEFSASQQYDPTVYNYIHSNLSPFLAWGLRFMFVMFESWNLNFLKSLLPPLCVSEEMREIHVLVINSFSAVYPVLLVILSLVLIHLHGKGNRVVQTLSKPLSCLAKKTKITSITSDAVIRAFATFIFLSAVKNLFSFYTAIRSTPIHRSIDRVNEKRVLYVDNTVDNGSIAHILYAMVPTVQCLFLVFIPSLLLFLYPTKLYKSLANKFLSSRKRLVIMMFVEALNSRYRTNFDGGIDYRSIAGIFLLFLPLLSICTMFVEVLIDNSFNLDILYCLISVSFSLLISYARPFKSTVTNISCSYYFMLFGIASIVAYLWYEQLSFPTQMLEILFAVIGLAAQAPFVMWVLYKLICYIKTKFYYSGSFI